MGFNNWHWHQKMTVEVEVNGKIITGSAVTSIHWWPNFFTGGRGLGFGPAWLSKVEGEAVTVDLGEGKYLIALLSYTRNHEYTENLATRSLYDTTRRVWIKEAFNSVLTRQKPIVVPRKVYPLLVTFRDVKNPKTIKEVDPDNLAASFGKGYRLKAITLNITDEPVITGNVKKVLGIQFFKNWVIIRKDALKRGFKDPYFRKLMAKLNRDDFIRKVDYGK